MEEQMTEDLFATIVKTLIADELEADLKTEGNSIKATFRNGQKFCLKVFEEVSEI